MVHTRVLFSHGVRTATLASVVLASACTRTPATIPAPAPTRSVTPVDRSAQRSRDWNDFRERLAAQAPRWRRLGVNYYRSAQIPW